MVSDFALNGMYWGSEKHCTASLEHLVSDRKVQDCHDWLIR